jgi:tetratricopeptide (TPR) repeat protein
LLEVEAAASRGDFAVAEKLLADVGASAEKGDVGNSAVTPSADGVQELLAALAAMRLAKQADAEAARRIAGVELAAGKLLSTLQPDGAAGAMKDSAAARRAAADALAAAGRRDEALAAYRALVAEFAADAAVQRGYAALLAAGNDRQSLAAALDQWRLVESKTRPATADWFSAKYEVAALHERLGDKQQALRVVTLLAALYPDLGGAEMKSKFDALRRRCQQ